MKNKRVIQVFSLLCLLTFAATAIGCGTMAGAGIGAAIGAIAGAPGTGAAIGAGIGALFDAAWIANELSAQQRAYVVTPRYIIHGPFYDSYRGAIWGRDQFGNIWVWNEYGQYWYRP